LRTFWLVAGGVSELTLPIPQPFGIKKRRIAEKRQNFLRRGAHAIG
jgi:hypothetical protein